MQTKYCILWQDNSYVSDSQSSREKKSRISINTVILPKKERKKEIKKESMIALMTNIEHEKEYLLYFELFH